MNILLLLTSLLLTPQKQEHKIELYVFNERCIDIANLAGIESFQRQWRDIARKYKPENVPILTNHDIVEFNTEEFFIKVSEEGWKLLENEKIPSRGIPVMLVIDGEVSYGAWLWNVVSSLTCDGISIVYSAASEERVLSIKQAQGIPDEWRIPKELSIE